MNGQAVARDGMAALQQDAQALDQLRRPVREIQEGALLDLAVLAIALAREHRRWRRD
jgi:hypothetical protein